MAQGVSFFRGATLASTEQQRAADQKEIFFRVAGLLSVEMDQTFYDTISIYFEGEVQIETNRPLHRVGGADSEQPFLLRTRARGPGRVGSAPA
jgi:hypothetical protein